MSSSPLQLPPHEEIMQKASNVTDTSTPALPAHQDILDYHAKTNGFPALDERNNFFNSVSKEKQPQLASVADEVGSLTQQFKFPSRSMYYTLLTENTPMDANVPKNATGDEGLFQVNTPLYGKQLNSYFKDTYNSKYAPSDPVASTRAAAYVMNQTLQQLKKSGIEITDPKEASVAYRTGATDYAIAKTGKSLDGTKISTTSPVYKAAVARYNERQQELSNRLKDVNEK